MGKIIWAVCDSRKDLYEMQRLINESGSMKLNAFISLQKMERFVTDFEKNDIETRDMPALILLDYDMQKKNNFLELDYIKNKQVLTGIPLFFMVKNKNDQILEECVEKGAILVVDMPFSRMDLIRIERMAWQHEVTKNYEKIMQNQSRDLKMAKEIQSLNEQLKSRNDLLSQIFGRYFSDQVLQTVLNQDPEKLLVGEKREMTVMLADIRGFTMVAKQMDPADMTSLLNHFFDHMVTIIMKYQGTVIELLGDAILAVFGAPIEDEAHALKACRAGLEMQKEMDAIREFSIVNQYPQLDIGIGIHTGNAFIGNIGSEKMMRYNVIGSAVNEASRLEGFSVGGQVLISESTYQRICEKAEIFESFFAKGKGLTEPLVIYNLQGVHTEDGFLSISPKDDEEKLITQDVIGHIQVLDKKQILSQEYQRKLVSYHSGKLIFEASIKEELIELMDVCISGYQGEILFFEQVYGKVTHKNETEIEITLTGGDRSFVERRLEQL